MSQQVWFICVGQNAIFGATSARCRDFATSRIVFRLKNVTAPLEFSLPVFEYDGIYPSNDKYRSGMLIDFPDGFLYEMKWNEIDEMKCLRRNVF